MAAYHLALLAGLQTLPGTKLRSRIAQSQQSLSWLAEQNRTGQKPFQNPCKKELRTPCRITKPQLDEFLRLQDLRRLIRSG
jgi:hypothetical protein